MWVNRLVLVALLGLGFVQGKNLRPTAYEGALAALLADVVLEASQQERKRPRCGSARAKRDLPSMCWKKLCVASLASSTFSPPRRAMSVKRVPVRYGTNN